MKENIDIKAVNLVKKYENFTAVNGVSFDVCQGEVFGFLGPNGAGKTTTINMLTGLAKRSSGEIHVAGIDCTKRHKAAQEFIGIVPDESNLYPELTGFENLCFSASLYGMKKGERKRRAAELLNTFNLQEAGNRKFGMYSKGMKRKLTIAAGIIHNPKILFLDEPTTGIDVASARQIRQLIKDLNKTGTTIFITTHYIEDAERLCDRIAFIVRGKIVNIDNVKNLLKQLNNKHLLSLKIGGNIKPLKAELMKTFSDYKIKIDNESQIIVESISDIIVNPFVHFFEKYNLDLIEAKQILPTLEEVYVEVTGINATELKKEKMRGGK